MIEPRLMCTDHRPTFGNCSWTGPRCVPYEAGFLDETHGRAQAPFFDRFFVQFGSSPPLASPGGPAGERGVHSAKKRKVECASDPPHRYWDWERLDDKTGNRTP